MKKKILSLLLALTMVLGLFPTAALAAEGAETVATAADFAAMSNSGSYRLTEDITVTEPYSATFRGSFDGGGHTVTLKVTSSANASVGLFKETGSGAEIKNLTVDADITAAGGGTSYGTGGLIGKVVSTTTVADCGVTGSVASTATGSYVAANVGGLVGLVSGDLTLSGSYAACGVSAASPYSSSSVGGLIGRTSNYYTLTVKDCYAAGSVTANKGYAGGLVGYVTCSANYPQSYENCYAAGKVTSAASAGNICGFGYVTATAGYRFANCYFNADENAAGSNKTIDGITGKTGAELKALAPALGDRFQADRAGGWPILDWQYVDPDARYDVTFTVTPADSLLTWNGEAQAPAADGKYRFADAAVGDYSYTVTNEAGDYASKSGTVTVKNKAVDVSVALALNTHRLTFALTPADADLTLRAGEETLPPGGDGAYAVTNGTYAYTASAFGYEGAAGEVTVDRADVEKTVALAEKPVDTVTFAYEAGKDAVTGGTLTVTTADGRTMTPEADGLTYRLPVGYAYTWTFKSANYARQSGSLDLTDRTEAMAETVTIPLAAKTAWEGGDDITEPALDGTVYQITSGSELAWFAKQVNQGKGSYQAALANDIDLGGQDWTPIGKSSSYAFKGSFDGQGHTIRGLAINAPSAANQGLFGYVNGGTVKNVTVEGTVTGGGSTAGLVGELAGAGLVENCVNKAAVTGINAVGGIVGKVSTATAKTVRACANLGAVTGSNQVGGIIGYLYYAVTLEDCYNRGDVAVSSSYGYAGGIAGVMDDGNAKASNCYTTGAVTGSSYAKPAVGQKRSGTAEKLYYLDTLGTDTNGTAKTGAELAALAPELGDAFIAAPAGVNDGYPIFPWQVPSYDAVFTVSPAEAEVAIDGYTGEQSGDTWTFRLPDGTYDYTVSAYGYVTKTGKLTVAGGGIQETVTLDAAQRKRVSFAVTPAGAAVTVTWNGTVVPPEADGSYSLSYGNYRYTVSAKGYARASGDFAVSGDSPAAYDVALTPSTAWDGTTLTSPAGSGTQAAPYEIGDGEELAWLADKVNAAAGGTVYAVLVNDIDLGGKTWAPIGADGHEFSGSFDGRGHTVSGLAVSGVRYAGLFGAIKDAAVTNVVVKGTAAAEGTGGIAGGIAAVAKGTANRIENCGSQVDLTSDYYAGGVLGSNFGSGAVTEITACYNWGAVNGKSRAGGILAYDNGKAPITDCYNTGAVTGEDYAGGIRAYYSSMAGAVTGCYNAGTVTGKTANTGAIVPGAAGVTGCYYLNTGADKNAGAQAMTLGDMQSDLVEKLGADKWKQQRGVNRNLPILQWQTAELSGEKVTLAKNIAFQREEIITLEGDETSLPLGQITWQAVPGAGSYTVSLWRAVKTWNALTAAEKAEYDAAEDPLDKLDIADENGIIAGMTDDQRARLALLDDAVDEADAAFGNNTATDSEVLKKLFKAQEDARRSRAAYIVSVAKEDELGYYIAVLTWAKDISGVTGTAYDASGDLAALDEGIYYASAAAETDGPAFASVEEVKRQVAGYQEPYNRMKAVTGLAWDNGAAKWDGKDCFTRSQVYRIDLFTVDDSGAAPAYTFFRTFTMPGQYTAANLSNVFAAEKKYAFKVTAVADEELTDRLGLSDSLDSGYSPIYDPSAAAPDPGEKEWVDISSAAQWVALANVEDVPSDGTGSPSRQQVEWGKNYRLTADLDFSALSAADQAKTKSIGTVTYPFMGELDGQGHKITGLTLSNSDSGLFWYTGSTGYVHDLTIEKANVLFSDNAAVLVHNNYGRLENCAVVNTNITADTGAVMGGMVSRNYGVIRKCYVEGGTLTSNSTTSVGHAGFVGANESGATIENCWTSMTVSTKSAHAGGFVGLGYGGTIRNCFALGNVSARSHSGGFVGRSVYQGNVYENCYAAGTVTVTDGEGNGFIGGNQSWSSFQYDQSEGIVNCYYNSATDSDHDYNAVGRSLEEMRDGSFLTAISGAAAGIWAQAADKNGGLPYLADVKAPETAEEGDITVDIAVAAYDKEAYAFYQMGETVSVTMKSNGNTRLVDLMDAAQEQGSLTYSYSTTSTFGRFIHTINGRAVNAPDGWMFTLNDTLSNVSASLAVVKDGDKVLWFEGTTENRFQGPTWAGLAGEDIQWETISTPAELAALAASADPAVLGKNYRLTADLDLSGVAFPGIGTAAAPFTGVFDGQKHTISNVTVAGGENAGFFGVIKGATIKDLNLVNVNITGTKRVGGLVGYAQAELDREDLSRNTANLVGNSTVTGTVSGTEKVGGLIGCNEGKTDPDTLFSIASAVDKCTADVAVTGSYQTGGLVGENGGAVTKSGAKGAVTAPGGAMTGGFVGDNTGDIYDSHAAGAVTGSNTTGGFAGYSDGTVKNCYSTGAVTGTDSTGSFAGAISRAENAMGAGQVTVSGTPTQGYTGGFAGRLGGTIAGLDNQVTVKNVWGNCTQPDGTALPPAGNASSFQSDSQKAALEGMTLTTWEQVGDTLYEHFGVNLPALESEGAKYADVIAISAAPGETVSLLKEGETADTAVMVRYAVSGDYLAGGAALTLVKANDTAATLTVPVELTLSGPGGTWRKTVQVILPVTEEKRTALMDAIAGTYTETKDGWTAMDMAAYAALPGKTASLTPAARQNVLDLLIAEAAGSAATASDRARVEIVLRSLGVDSTRLYPVNSNQAVNNAEKLAAMDLTAPGYYTAPYILLAARQGNVTLSESQTAALIALLKDNMGNGLFTYEWDGVTYQSPDTAGAALAALAPYYGTNEAAKAVVDTILAALPGALNDAGSFGDANSDAMVILGLLALGRDPGAVKAPSGASLVDGMLGYVNTATDKFQYAGADNALATEQAFRALVALARFDGANAFNIYDFSAVSAAPGRATGSGESETPVTPPDSNPDLTVTVAVTADRGAAWLVAKSVTVKEGSTVYHAFVKALEGNGITQVGAANGYVSSMTKDGRTLAEFTAGPNSGWLYKVNGTLPQVPLTQQVLADGDTIEFYYTGDWTTDPDAGSMGGGTVAKGDPAAVVDLIDKIGTVTKDSGAAISAARKAYDALTEAEKAKVTNYKTLTEAEAAYAKLAGLPFTDVAASAWYFEAVRYAYEKGLFTGTTASTFSPDGTMDRAMLVTVLHRLAGTPAEAGGNAFADVTPCSWYEKAVAWASSKGIVTGVSETSFAPETGITREQLAAMLYRYAKAMGYDVSAKADLTAYNDGKSVSDWAADAMAWAVGEGLITGRTASSLAPQGGASRAEVATILWRFCEKTAK